MILFVYRQQQRFWICRIWQAVTSVLTWPVMWIVILSKENNNDVNCELVISQRYNDTWKLTCSAAFSKSSTICKQTMMFISNYLELDTTQTNVRVVSSSRKISSQHPKTAEICLIKMGMIVKTGDVNGICVGMWPLSLLKKIITQ